MVIVPRKSEVGRKYVLWATEYATDAYVDQHGLAHGARVVLAECVVTVTKDPFMARANHSDEKSHGVIGVTADGRQFERHLPGEDMGIGDSDSWKRINQPSEEAEPPRVLRFSDACDTYNRHPRGTEPVIRLDGSRAVPPKALICTAHDRAFMPDHPVGCWSCFSESAAASNAA